MGISSASALSIPTTTGSFELDCNGISKHFASPNFNSRTSTKALPTTHPSIFALISDAANADLNADEANDEAAATLDACRGCLVGIMDFCTNASSIIPPLNGTSSTIALGPHDTTVLSRTTSCI